MTVEFRLLGPISVSVDGRTLDLGGLRQRSLLTLLVLNRNRVVGTETLADRLWPDDQPLTAIKTIQVYVSRLRQMLRSEASRLASVPGGYSLMVRDEDLDAAQFEALLVRARREVGDGSGELATFQSALALWRGPALADVATEPFARLEAERLEELRLQAVEELSDLRLTAGHAREVVGDLRQAVGEHPERERLLAQLMRALYADGRQTEALAAYREARRYLSEELGIDPSPALQELERSILRQELVGPEAPATHGGHVPTTPAPAEAAATDGGKPPPPRRSRRVVTVVHGELRPQAAGSGDADPEVMESLAGALTGRARQAVERHGGEIYRLEADTIVAVFGLSAASEDDALRAVRAASELQSLTEGDAALAHPEPGVTVRVGIATGEVIATSTAPGAWHVSGGPMPRAAQLAAEAGMGEVLLSPDAQWFLRANTTTERVSIGVPGAADLEAYRLLFLTSEEPIARMGGTRLVGRTRELMLLEAAFERVARDQEIGLALVIGGPGVGKSRLAAELFGRIGTRARVLRSRCLPYGSGITYWPIREIVHAAIGITADESTQSARAKLDASLERVDQGSTVSGHLSGILGLSDDPVPTEEIPWAVRRFMEAQATAGPVVVQVDDLQWAEPALFDTLDHVLDLGRGPILLVLLARPELLDLRADLFTRASSTVLRLEPLDEEDAASLVDELSVEQPLPPELRERVLTAADGNPLFVEQFVAYLADHQEEWSHSELARLAVPPTVSALLAARLDRLPHVERQPLERAAVVGRRFWTGAVAELTIDGERPELTRQLAALARRELIRPDRSEFPDDEAYRFRHLLIRDAAYAALPKTERAMLHERFALWLERKIGDRKAEYDDILGYHYEQACAYRTEVRDRTTADVCERAVVHLQAAGRRALLRGEYASAYATLGRAYELSPRDVAVRMSLLEMHGWAARNSGRVAAAIATFEQLSQLAEDRNAENVALRARILTLDAKSLETPSAFLELEGLLRTAIPRLTRLGDGEGIDLAHRLANDLLWERLRWDDSAAWHTTIPKSPESPYQVLGASAATTPLLMGHATIRECLVQVRATASSDASPLAQFTLAVTQAFAAVLQAEPDAMTWLDQAEAIRRDVGALTGYPASTVTLALLAVGDDIQSDACARRARERFETTGDKYGRATALAQQADALARLGRIDESRSVLNELEPLDPGDLLTNVIHRRALARCERASGNAGEAVRVATEGLRLLADAQSPLELAEAHIVLAEALVGVGRRAEARSKLIRAREIFDAKGATAAVSRVDAIFDQLGAL